MENSYCIMPEMPYCPCCKFGRIEQSFEDPDNPDWICLCTKSEYDKYLTEQKETTDET
jgi:hypothetical protein